MCCGLHLLQPETSYCPTVPSPPSPQFICTTRDLCRPNGDCTTGLAGSQVQAQASLRGKSSQEVPSASPWPAAAGRREKGPSDNKGTRAQAGGVSPGHLRPSKALQGYRHCRKRRLEPGLISFLDQLLPLGMPELPWSALPTPPTQARSPLPHLVTRQPGRALCLLPPGRACGPGLQESRRSPAPS